MNQEMPPRVFVDGNSVMGSRAVVGGAAGRRNVAEVALLARAGIDPRQ